MNAMPKGGLLALLALGLVACTQPSTGAPAVGASTAPTGGASGGGTAAAAGPLNLVAITEDGKLLRFKSDAPGAVESVDLKGLNTNDKLVGIDWRASNGKLYALGFQSRLYTLDAATGQATAVAAEPFAALLDGGSFGFDVNPAADRLRVVSETRQNLRLHPDTGAAVDADATAAGLQQDGPLAFAAGDANAAASAYVVGAAYTNNDTNPSTGTTNYVLEARLGVLATQGTKEGVTPVVSPNGGKLYTVGALGVKPDMLAGFDIGGPGDQGFAAFNVSGETAFKLYRIDLGSGAATLVGAVGSTQRLTGLAILP